MLNELLIPKFATEAEESAWWESHEDRLVLEFEDAVATGRIDPEKLNVPFVSVELDPEDIAKARVQAAGRGLRYQTYLKMIIHEALRAAEKTR